jgi:hypothetical protein
MSIWVKAIFPANDTEDYLSGALDSEWFLIFARLPLYGRALPRSGGREGA